MVYIYLVQYADYNATCRELALLSINTFQNDMTDTNPLFRALALRVLTSIRVPDILAIQLLAAKKCSMDASPYVRKCSATALAKLYAMIHEYNDAEVNRSEIIFQLKGILEILLNDTTPLVLGNAIYAFNVICPSSYELIHVNYRRMCNLICDMNEWMQVAVLDVFTRYARNQFPDPNPNSMKTVQSDKVISSTTMKSSNAFKATTVANNGTQYECVVSNSFGSVTTNVVLLTISTARQTSSF